jgi:hypothetical protein
MKKAVPKRSTPRTASSCYGVGGGTIRFGFISDRAAMRQVESTLTSFPLWIFTNPSSISRIKKFCKLPKSPDPSVKKSAVAGLAWINSRISLVACSQQSQKPLSSSTDSGNGVVDNADSSSPPSPTILQIGIAASPSLIIT